MEFINNILLNLGFLTSKDNVFNFVIPNVTYCEQAVSGLIARPGYAISNIPYIIVGLIIVLKSESKLLKLFGITSIIIGLCSFFYDATFTHLSQYFDWNGMFTLIALLLSVNLMRLKVIKRKQILLTFVILVALHLIASLFIRQLNILLFAAGTITIVISEIYLFSQKRIDRAYYKLWFIGFGLFLIGWGIWQLDFHKVICDPSNFFNGRGVFHYLTAITIYLLYRFYSEVLASEN